MPRMLKSWNVCNTIDIGAVFTSGQSVLEVDAPAKSADKCASLRGRHAAGKHRGSKDDDVFAAWTTAPECLVKEPDNPRKES